MGKKASTVKWMQVKLDVDLEAVEPVCDLLARHVYGSVVVEQNSIGHLAGEAEVSRFSQAAKVSGYVPLNREFERTRQHIELAAALLGQLRPIGPPEWSEVREEDWATSWKEHYHVLRVGQRIIIKPSWEEYKAESNEAVVELDPGMAFGTGLHPTTQLCLQQLERRMGAGARVLDVGTGSGILAIAAMRLGAESVLALDTDPVAVKAARANVRQNGLAKSVRVRRGSLNVLSRERVSPGAFDIVVANIVAAVITDLASGLVECLRPGGVLITSGIIAERESQVLETLKVANLANIEVEHMGDWAAIVGVR